MKPNIGQGDSGKSFVFGSGKRFPKDSAQFEALGVLDELNSYVGVARTHGDDAAIDRLLVEIQQTLFAAGAVLATEEGYEKHKMIPSFGQKKVKDLERALQKYEEDLPKLENFILPSGTPFACALYVCRTLSRTAERRVVTFSTERDINPAVQAYLNRLADLFFALSRYVNQQAGMEENIWQSNT